MIILKFTDGEIQAAKILKPEFRKGIEEILKEMYTEEVANRHTEEIVAYINDSMQFPKNGLYHIKEGTLYKFNAEKNTWEVTGESLSDYYITEDATMWACFNDQFLYLQDMSNEIKQYVKERTEAMFDIDDWLNVSSIDCNSWRFYYQEYDGIAGILRSFFNEAKAMEFAEDVRRELFQVGGKKIVVIQEGSFIKSAITTSEVLKFNENNIKKVEKIFNTKLKPAEISELIIRLRNLLCYGVDTAIGTIIGFNEDEDLIINHNGNEIILMVDTTFIKVDSSIYYAIKEAVDSINLHEGEDNNGFMSSIDFLLSVPKLNGLQVYASRNNYELRISVKIPETYSSSFGERFVNVVYENGKEVRKYYKWDFIDHYVCVKL